MIRLSVRLGSGGFSDSEPGELVVPCGPGLVAGLHGVDGALGECELVESDALGGRNWHGVIVEGGVALCQHFPQHEESNWAYYPITQGKA